MSVRPQRRRRSARPRTGQWCWIYDGRNTIAEIRQQADGWRVTMMSGRTDIGRAFPTREDAVAAVPEAAASAA